MDLEKSVFEIPLDQDLDKWVPYGVDELDLDKWVASPWTAMLYTSSRHYNLAYGVDELNFDKWVFGVP